MKEHYKNDVRVSLKAKFLAGLVAASVTLTACAPFGPFGSFSGPVGPGSFYCDRNPFFCGMLGVLIVAGIYWASAGSSSAVHGMVPGPHTIASDKRLKTDIKFAGEMESGLKVYAFRYRGDERYFSGVLAEDLLENPRFAHAVARGEDGYLRVDYSVLGVEMILPEVMAEAGQAALKAAQ